MNDFQKKEINALIYSEWKKSEKFEAKSTDINTPDSDRARLRRVSMEHFYVVDGMLQVIYILGETVKYTDDGAPQVA